MDDYEKELIERFYGSVDIQSPCPNDVTFIEFRCTMTKINDKIYKKIIKPGLGAEIDLERTVVIFEYAKFIEGFSDPIDSSWLNKKSGVVNVKKGIEPLPGVYLALTTMKKGEESLFWISNELMFGKFGKFCCSKLKTFHNVILNVLGCPPRVPPAVDILLHAKVNNITEEEDKDEEEQDEMSKSFEKLWKDAAKSFKLASEQFKTGNFSKAVCIYRKWIEKLENLHLKNDEEESKQKELLTRMYQNICVCYNKLGKPEKTCVMMRQMEKLTPIGDNPKALYAKGKANMLLNNFKDARKYFMMAERLKPTDQGITKALCDLKIREKETTDAEVEEDNLMHKFQSEASKIAKEKQNKAIIVQEAQEKLKENLAEFKSKLAEKIEKLKNNDAIESLNLSTEISSHQHIELAEKMCRQNQIELKGTELISKEETIYYLSKKM
jgi:FK506-binding protein 6